MIKDFARGVTRNSKPEPLGSPIDIVKALWEKRFELKIDGGYSLVRSDSFVIILLRSSETLFGLRLVGFTEPEEKELRHLIDDAL